MILNAVNAESQKRQNVLLSATLTEGEQERPLCSERGGAGTAAGPRPHLGEGGVWEAGLQSCSSLPPPPPPALQRMGSFEYLQRTLMLDIIHAKGVLCSQSVGRASFCLLLEARSAPTRQRPWAGLAGPARDS